MTQTNNTSRRSSHRAPRYSKQRLRSRSPARSPVRLPVRPSVEHQSFSQSYNDMLYHCHHVDCPRYKGKGFGTAVARGKFSTFQASALAKYVDAHIAATHSKSTLHEQSSENYFCTVLGCKKMRSEGFQGFTTIKARGKFPSAEIIASAKYLDAHVNSHKLEPKPISSKPALANGNPSVSTKQLSRKRAWSPSPPKVYFCTKTSCKKAAPGNGFQGFITVQARGKFLIFLGPTR